MESTKKLRKNSEMGRNIRDERRQRNTPMCVTMALKSYAREFRNRMSNGTNIITFILI